MRALMPSSSFSRWVLPVRLIGLATGLLGLSIVVVEAGATGIVVAVVGFLVWQAGTLLEERSTEFRRLNGTPARDVMLTERIDVQSWLKVARVRERFLDASEQTFFVALQDGYESGIVLPASSALSRRRTPVTYQLDKSHRQSETSVPYARTIRCLLRSRRWSGSVSRM